jgi:transposase
MPKKYIVRLSADERKELKALVNKGKTAAYKRLHAQVLLKADISKNGSCWTDKKISEAFDIGLRTVERIRQRLVEGGLESAINRAKQERTKSRKLDGEQEAYLIALSCGEPPEGRARWTLRLLASRLVELDYVEGISHETIRQVLKKRNKALAEKRMVYSTSKEC